MDELQGILLSYKKQPSVYTYHSVVKLENSMLGEICQNTKSHIFYDYIYMKYSE